jgi:hypothetical protein
VFVAREHLYHYWHNPGSTTRSREPVPYRSTTEHRSRRTIDLTNTCRRHVR